MQNFLNLSAYQVYLGWITLLCFLVQFNINVLNMNFNSLLELIRYISSFTLMNINHTNLIQYQHEHNNYLVSYFLYETCAYKSSICFIFHSINNKSKRLNISEVQFQFNINIWHKTGCIS